MLKRTARRNAIIRAAVALMEEESVAQRNRRMTIDPGAVDSGHIVIPAWALRSTAVATADSPAPFVAED